MSVICVLVKCLKVDINYIIGIGNYYMIISDDVEWVVCLIEDLGEVILFRGVCRSMVCNMVKVYVEVVKVIIQDDVDVEYW